MDARASWRAPELGKAREVDLPGGRVRVHERGEGPVIVFVHGFLVNSNLWRKVVAPLAGDFHCVTVDMPMGAHLHPMAESADLSAPGQAHLVTDVIERLGLDDVTLVGNDTGGAVSQMVAAHRPERLAGLIADFVREHSDARGQPPEKATAPPRG
jgi:pimeloyl-ACP methyl ester carboxylesterase